MEHRVTKIFCITPCPLPYALTERALSQVELITRRNITVKIFRRIFE